METFPIHPCCYCRKNLKPSSDISNLQDTIIQSVWETFEIRIEETFKLVFERFIRYLRGIDECNFKYDFYSSSEVFLMESIYKILTEFIKKDPSKVDMDKVNTLDDIIPVLQQNLCEIGEKITDINLEIPFRILDGQASYQRLVIDCFIFTGKFTSQCMDLFEKDSNTIVENATETLLKFFEEQNVYNWIRHDSQVLEPFGKFLPSYE